MRRYGRYIADLRNRKRLPTTPEEEEDEEEARPRPTNTAPAASSSLGWVPTVLGLGLIAAVIGGVIALSVLDPACTRGCGPAPASTPTAAPTPLPNSVYSTSTPFVYAVGAYSDHVYLAAKWDAAGTVHHPSDTYELYETIEACPSASACSLLILVNATHVIGPSMRFEGFRIDQVYANETHVVVMGVHPEISGWDIPGGVTIDRTIAGRTGAIIMYNRDVTTGTLTYIHSALVLEPVDHTGDFKMNKGDMVSGRIFASFSGSCADGEYWAFTPMLVNHTSDDSQDMGLACSRYQAVAMVYEGPVLRTVWQIEGAADNVAPIVHIRRAGGEGPTYVLVYGVYGSDADGLTPDEFQIPLFSSTPTPGGNVPGVASPPGPNIPWTSDWPAGFMIRYDYATLELVDWVRHEIVTRNIDFIFDGDYGLCGDTVTFTTLHLYELSTSGMSANATFTDPEETVLSPFCCYWTNDGDLIDCNIYRGTSETVMTSAENFVFTALTPGTVQRSDGFTIADASEITFVFGAVVNMTLPIDGVISQSSYNGNFDDGSLVYDGSTYGQYMSTPNQLKFWYAVEGGILVYVD